MITIACLEIVNVLIFTRPWTKNIIKTPPLLKKASKVDTPLARELHGTPPAAADSTSALRQVQPINTIAKATLLKKDVPQAANIMAPHDQHLLRDKQSRDQHLLRDKQSRVQQPVRDCDKTRNKDNVCNKLQDFYQRWNYKPLLTIKNPCDFAIASKTSFLPFFNSFSQKKDVYNLLIAVKSHCAATDRRKAVRETWGNRTWINLHAGTNDAKLVFLMGKCTSKEDFRRVQLEQQHHNDILQWDFKDSFRNLTVKECLFLRFVAKQCQASTHIFKGDDDIILNPRNLLHLVKSAKKKDDVFIGSVLDGSPAVRDDWSKYYTPRSLYRDDYYPVYVSGGGYVMSTRIATKLYEQIPHVSLIPIDDAFVGILLKRIKKRPSHNEQFMSWGTRKTHVHKCFWHDVITFHKRLPKQLYTSWVQLAESVHHCDPLKPKTFSYTLQRNKDVKGNDIRTIHGRSVQICKKHCQDLVYGGCEGFVHFDNLCFLKSASSTQFIIDKKGADLYQLNHGNLSGFIEIGRWY